MINSSIKVLLALAALALVCHAQQNLPGQQCLCANVTRKVDAKKDISDIQIYPSSDFCSQVEIIITNKFGRRYCLDPNMKAARLFVNRMIQAKK